MRFQANPDCTILGQNVTCASKTGIMSAALFLRKMKIKKIGRNFLSLLSLLSQNNGRGQLLFQNDIILEIII
jgi:hypothetical protein